MDTSNQSSVDATREEQLQSMSDAAPVTCNWDGETLQVGDTRRKNGEQYQCWASGEVGKNGKKC